MVIHLTEQQMIENPVILKSLRENIERNGLELAREYVQGLPLLVSKDGKYGWNNGILPYKRLWLKSVAGRTVRLEDLHCDNFSDMDDALTSLMYAELGTDHVSGKTLDEIHDSAAYRTFEFKDISFDIEKDGIVRRVVWGSRVYSMLGDIDEEDALKQAQAALLTDIRFCDAGVIPYIIELHDMEEPSLRRAETVDGLPLTKEDELLFWNTDEGHVVRNIVYSPGRRWNGCPDGISPMTRKYWEDRGLGDWFGYVARYRLGPMVGLLPVDAYMSFPNWTSGVLDMYGSMIGRNGSWICEDARL